MTTHAFEPHAIDELRRRHSESGEKGRVAGRSDHALLRILAHDLASERLSEPIPPWHVERPTLVQPTGLPLEQSEA